MRDSEISRRTFLRNGTVSAFAMLSLQRSTIKSVCAAKQCERSTEEFRNRRLPSYVLWMAKRMPQNLILVRRQDNWVVGPRFIADTLASVPWIFLRPHGRLIELRLELDSRQIQDMLIRLRVLRRRAIECHGFVEHGDHIAQLVSLCDVLPLCWEEFRRPLYREEGMRPVASSRHAIFD